MKSEEILSSRNNTVATCPIGHDIVHIGKI